MNKTDHDQQRDRDAFSAAHEGAAQAHGWRWITANDAAVQALANWGYDAHDLRTKAVASLVVRAVLDRMK